MISAGYVSASISSDSSFLRQIFILLEGNKRNERTKKKALDISLICLFGVFYLFCGYFCWFLLISSFICFHSLFMSSSFFLSSLIPMYTVFLSQRVYHLSLIKFDFLNYASQIWCGYQVYNAWRGIFIVVRDDLCFLFFLTYHFDLVSQHGSITLLGFDRGITWITLINNIITIIFPLGGM